MAVVTYSGHLSHHHSALFHWSERVGWRAKRMCVDVNWFAACVYARADRRSLTSFRPLRQRANHVFASSFIARPRHR